MVTRIHDNIPAAPNGTAQSWLSGEAFAWNVGPTLLCMAWVVWLTMFSPRHLGRIITHLLYVFYYRNKSEYLHIGSVSFGVIAGVILFGDVRYSTVDYVLDVESGYIQFKYWKWIGARKKDGEKDRSPSRLHVNLNNPRLHVFNNSAAYRKIAKLYSNLTHFYEWPVEKPVKEKNASGDKTYEESWWSLMGACRVTARDGLFILGNQLLPHKMVAGFATMNVRVSRQNAHADLYQIACEAKANNVFIDLEEYTTHKPRGDGSCIKHKETIYPEEPRRLKKEPVPLTDGQALHKNKDTKRVFSVLKTGKATINVKYDRVGRVKEEVQSATRDAPVSETTIRLGAATYINYGPWADREKCRLYDFFFPPDYQTTPVTTMPRHGEWRVHVGHSVHVVFDALTSVCIYFPRPDEARAEGAEPVQDKLYMALKPDTRVDMHAPWVCGEEGSRTTVRVELAQAAVTATLPHQHVMECDKLVVDVGIEYPRAYKQLQIWTMDVSLKRPSLMFTFDFKNFIANLIDAWGPAHAIPKYNNDAKFFVPYKLALNVLAEDFEVRLLLNSCNWVSGGETASADENQEVAIVGHTLQMDCNLDSLHHKPLQLMRKCNLTAVEQIALRVHYPLHSAALHVLRSLHRNAALHRRAASKSPYGRSSGGQGNWVEVWRTERVEAQFVYKYYVLYNYQDESEGEEEWRRLFAGETDVAKVEKEKEEKPASHPSQLPPHNMDIEIGIFGSEVELSGAVIHCVFQLIGNYVGLYDTMTNVHREMGKAEKKEKERKRDKNKTLDKTQDATANHTRVGGNVTRYGNVEYKDPKMFRPLNVTFALRIHNPRAHCVLQSPIVRGERGDEKRAVECPHLSSEEFVVEVRKDCDGMELQISLAPTVAFFPRSPLSPRDGFLSIAGLQLRGHSLCSQVDVPWDMGAVEYGWSMEVIVGEAHSRIDLAQLLLVKDYVEGLLLLIVSDDEKMRQPEQFIFCQHGNQPRDCAHMKKALSRRPPPQQKSDKDGLAACLPSHVLKMDMIRVAVDGAQLVVMEGEHAVQVCADPIRLSLCNTADHLVTAEHGNSMHFHVVVPRIHVNQMTQTVSSDWLQATALTIEKMDLHGKVPIRGEFEVAEGEPLQPLPPNMDRRRVEFIKKHDQKTRRLSFLYGNNELRMGKCACTGDSMFFCSDGNRDTTGLAWLHVTPSTRLCVEDDEYVQSVGEQPAYAQSILHEWGGEARQPRGVFSPSCTDSYPDVPRQPAGKNAGKTATRPSAGVSKAVLHAYHDSLAVYTIVDVAEERPGELATPRLGGPTTVREWVAKHRAFVTQIGVGAGVLRLESVEQSAEASKEAREKLETAAIRTAVAADDDETTASRVCREKQRREKWVVEGQLAESVDVLVTPFTLSGCDAVCARLAGWSAAAHPAKPVLDMYAECASGRRHRQPLTEAMFRDEKGVWKKEVCVRVGVPRVSACSVQCGEMAEATTVDKPRPPRVYTTALFAHLDKATAKANHVKATADRDGVGGVVKSVLSAQLVHFIPAEVWRAEHALHSEPAGSRCQLNWEEMRSVAPVPPLAATHPRVVMELDCPVKMAGKVRLKEDEVEEVEAAATVGTLHLTMMKPAKKQMKEKGKEEFPMYEVLYPAVCAWLRRDSGREETDSLNEGRRAEHNLFHMLYHTYQDMGERRVAEALAMRDSCMTRLKVQGEARRSCPSCCLYLVLLSHVGSEMAHPQSPPPEHREKMATNIQGMLDKWRSEFDSIINVSEHVAEELRERSGDVRIDMPEVSAFGGTFMAKKETLVDHVREEDWRRKKKKKKLKRRPVSLAAFFHSLYRACRLDGVVAGAIAACPAVALVCDLDCLVDVLEHDLTARAGFTRCELLRIRGVELHARREKQVEYDPSKLRQASVKITLTANVTVDNVVFVASISSMYLLKEVFLVLSHARECGNEESGGGGGEKKRRDSSLAIATPNATANRTLFSLDVTQLSSPDGNQTRADANVTQWANVSTMMSAAAAPAQSAQAQRTHNNTMVLWHVDLRVRQLQVVGKVNAIVVKAEVCNVWLSGNAYLSLRRARGIDAPQDERCEFGGRGEAALDHATLLVTSHGSDESAGRETGTLVTARIANSTATLLAGRNLDRTSQLTALVALGDVVGMMPMSAKGMTDLLAENGEDITVQWAVLTSARPAASSPASPSGPVVDEVNEYQEGHQLPVPVESQPVRAVRAPPRMPARKQAVKKTRVPLDLDVSIASVCLSAQLLECVHLRYKTDTLRGLVKCGGEHPGGSVELRKHDIRLTMYEKTKRPREREKAGSELELTLPSILVQLDKKELDKEQANLPHMPGKSAAPFYGDSEKLPLVWSMHVSLGVLAHSFSNAQLNQFAVSLLTFKEEIFDIVHRFKTCPVMVKRQQQQPAAAPAVSISEREAAEERTPLWDVRVSTRESPCVRLTASTPTHVAARVTVESLGARVTNTCRKKGATKDEKPVWCVVLSGEASVCVQVGRLVVEEGEMEEHAALAAALALEKKPEVDREKKWVVTLHRPVVFAKMTAPDKMAQLERDYKKTLKHWKRLHDDFFKGKKSASQVDVSAAAGGGAESSFWQNFQLTALIKNGLYVCVPLYSPHPDPASPAIVCALQSADAMLCVANEVACIATFHHFRVALVEHFDEHTLTDGVVRSRGGHVSNLLSCDKSTIQACGKADTLPSKEGRDSRLTLSCRWQMDEGAAIDLDQRIGFLMQIVQSTLLNKHAKRESGTGLKDAGAQLRALEKKVHDVMRRLQETKPKSPGEVEALKNELCKYDAQRFALFRRMHVAEKREKEREKKSSEEGGSSEDDFRAADAPNYYVDVQVSIASGKCTLRSQPKQDESAAGAGAGKKKKRGGKLSAVSKQQHSTTELMIPGLDVKMYYITDEKDVPAAAGFDFDTTGMSSYPRDPEQSRECAGGSSGWEEWESRRPVRKPSQEKNREREESREREKKMGCVYVNAVLSSPDKTVITPIFADFVDNVLGAQREWEAKIGREGESAVASTAQPDVTTVMANATERSMPFDVVFCVSVQSSVISLESPAVGKREAGATLQLQLPSLALMGWTRTRDGTLDVTLKLTNFSLRVFKPQWQSAVRHQYVVQLSLDHFSLILSASRNKLCEAERKMRGVLTANIGKALFYYDMRKLSELLAAPRPWMRKEIRRLLGPLRQQQQSQEQPLPAESQVAAAAAPPPPLLPGKPRQWEVMFATHWKELSVTLEMGAQTTGELHWLSHNGTYRVHGKVNSAYERDLLLLVRLARSELKAGGDGSVIEGEAALDGFGVTLAHKRSKKASPVNTCVVEAECLSARLAYMHRPLVVVKCARPSASVRDEWTSRVEKGECVDSALGVHVCAGCGDLQLIISRATLPDLIHTADKCSYFANEQKKAWLRALEEWKEQQEAEKEETAERAQAKGSASLLDGEKSNKESPSSAEGKDKHKTATHVWTKVLDKLSMQQTVFGLLPMPKNGHTSATGSVRVEAGRVTLVLMNGEFTANNWALITMEYPAMAFRPQAMLKFIDNASGHDRTVGVDLQQQLSIGMGKREEKEKEKGGKQRSSLVVCRVDKNGEHKLPRPHTMDQQLEYYIGDVLSQLGREATGQKPDPSWQALSALQQWRYHHSVTALLEVPAVVVKALSAQLNDCEATAASEAAVRFRVDSVFHGHVYVKLELIQASFLIELKDGYKKMMEEGSLILETGSVLDKDREKGKGKKDSGETAGGVGGGGGEKKEEEEKGSKERDRRVFVCGSGDWHFEPTFRFMGEHWDPPGLELVMSACGVFDYRHSLPRIVQQGLLDSLDGVVSEGLLCLLKVVEMDEIANRKEQHASRKE